MSESRVSARTVQPDGVVARPWGVTRGRITFDPPAQTPDDLKLVRQEQADGSGLVRCFLQAEPARQMPHLRGIPILILVSEASYLAPYDHCTAKFLDQDAVHLLDLEFFGNIFRLHSSQEQ